MFLWTTRDIPVAFHFGQMQRKLNKQPISNTKGYVQCPSKWIWMPFKALCVQLWQILYKQMIFSRRNKRNLDVTSKMSSCCATRWVRIERHHKGFEFTASACYWMDWCLIWICFHCNGELLRNSSCWICFDFLSVFLFFYWIKSNSQYDFKVPPDRSCLTSGRIVASLVY